MATMKVRLISKGTHPDDLNWSGKCPTCEQERLFSFQNLVSKDTNVAVAKSVARFIIDIFVSYKVFARGFTASKPLDKIACEACGHVMWICPNCRMAFSVDPVASTAQCPNCGTLTA